MLDGIDKLTEVPSPNWIDSKNSGDFYGVMRLCEEVITDEEKTMLFSGKEKQAEIENHETIIKSMLHGFQDRAFNRMRELDGKKAKQTKAVLGIGKRYNVWKKKNTVISPTQQQINFAPKI